jgi:hypothetical protein
MICFAITRAYQFPLPLSLPSIPTPSYTNRPQWLRALLTSDKKTHSAKAHRKE